MAREAIRLFEVEMFQLPNLRKFSAALWGNSFLWMSCMLANGEGLIVHNLLDDGAGSLRECIAEAAPKSTITFAPGLSGETIVLTSGQLVIDKTLRIDASPLEDEVTVSGNDRSRVFEILPGADVTMKSLIISRGRSLDGVDNDPAYHAADGGGVKNRGSLRLEECVIRENRTGAGAEVSFNGAPGTGGDGGRGGGIHNEAQLVLVRCTVTANVTGGGASGEVSGIGGHGGGISNTGDLEMLQCEVFANRTGDGGDGSFGSHEGGGAGGGIYSSNFDLNRGSNRDYPDGAICALNSCTIRNNETGNAGRIADIPPSTPGGMGGGIFVGDGMLSETSSTVSGNRTGVGARGNWDGSLPVGDQGWGGGIAVGRNTNPITIVSSTVSNNEGGRGGGISVSAMVILRYSVIAANHADDQLPRSPGESAEHDVLGDVDTTEGVNFIGTLDGATTSPGSLVLTGDAQLAPVGSYGGPTMTMPPLADSPLINATTVGAEEFDQRGFARVGLPDLGAVEFQGASDIARFYPLGCFDFAGPPGPDSIRFSMPIGVSDREFGVVYSPDLSTGSWTEIGNLSIEEDKRVFVDSDPERVSRSSGFYSAFLRPELP